MSTAEPRPHVALHHVQVAIPVAGEDRARGFYGAVLGFEEVPKPPALALRGGVWFRAGDLELHLGVEDPFRPARKAHPGILLADLDGALDRLRDAGVAVDPDEDLPGYRRVYVTDPFGNRIELLTPTRAAPTGRDVLDADLGAGVRLRRAHREDVAAIVALLDGDPITAARDRPPAPGPTPSPAHLRAFAAVDADPAHDLVVGVTEDGRVVATLQLTVIPGLDRAGRDRGQVEAVRVAAELQGRGIGEALMRWAAGRATARGCGMLQLTSDRQRERAHAFYDRLGFAASHVGYKLPLP